MGRDALVAWAAGFLDGEGHFRARPGRRTGSVEIEVHQVNPAPLRRLLDLFGGHLELRRRLASTRCRSVYRWRVTGARARRAAAALLPFLMNKRPEAEAVAFMHLYPDGSAMRDYYLERAQEARKREYDNHLD